MADSATSELLRGYAAFQGGIYKEIWGMAVVQDADKITGGKLCGVLSFIDKSKNHEKLFVN